MCYSVMLSFTILRGQSEPDFIPLSTALPASQGPVSPLFAPHGDLSQIYGRCSVGTFEIIRDMHALTFSFLGEYSFGSRMQLGVTSHSAQAQQIYSRLLRFPSTEDDLTPDWVYESCRLAALIYCRSIVHGATLAESASVMHARSSGLSLEPTTLLTALHDALARTDTRGCWGNELRGMFLWVCLVGGAASWRPTTFVTTIEGDAVPPASAWARKCFALYAVRASVAVPFEHAGAVTQALRTMLQVRNYVGLHIASQAIVQ